MGTSISVRFPLGRYHATRWDGGANTSEVEWPPSPWRILRALVATWYSRWPDLPFETLDRVLAKLGTPDAYWTPLTTTGTTRHYMPGISHPNATTGNTAQVIDAFLAISPSEALHIHWPADLTDDDREVLRKLVELLPYLGRSESVCDAVLDEDEVTPDAGWWRLGESGDDVRHAELLAPDGQVDRAYLEMTTTATRRTRRLLPAGSRKVIYGMKADLAVVPEPCQNLQRIKCMRLDLAGPVALRAGAAVIAVDTLHSAIAKRLSGLFDPDEVAALVGRDPTGGPRRGPHDHLHLIALPASTDTRTPLPAAAEISSLYLWSRAGIPPHVAGAIQQEIRQLWAPSHLAGKMADQYLLAAAHGDAATLLPQLVGPAVEWTSLTPYLPVRHRKKRQSPVEFLAEDLQHETASRELAAPVEVTLIDSATERREILQYRRRRNQEKIAQTRSGVYLKVRFAEPVTGPILFGQLSHFGYGVFVPVS